ncbi:sodium:calcium antiporter [Halocalculus aciditolerans]|uniref:Sodium/hydrogen exchanger n=1 Tax=Halocalculus aciditolerans TaxID=1383812 RepID=A0A830FFX9_9EURY|nr:sodium:calcium antiporter [Halocalculus aciditolerans]GGL71629.1 sodium/hydrogen exchanger [Halocalculus aciditolerans]
MNILGAITASPILSTVVFLIGVVIVVFSVEEFVEHVAATAVGLGVSTFILTVVLAGTDLENAILGGAAVLGHLPDVGLGTIFGEAVFILCMALGLGGVIVPFEIDTPPKYLALTGVSPALLLGLSLDGTLSRLDGVILTVAFVPAVYLLYRWEQTRSTHYLEPEEELEEELEEAAEGDEELHPYFRLGILVLAVVGMTVGSELAVQGTKGLLAYTGIAQLAFGATVLSFIASLEEVFLTVEPVRDGKPAVAAGNVVGSMIFFVTSNAGVLALIQPLHISTTVWTVQYPFFLAALGVVLLVLYRGVVSRPIGLGLIVMYGLYWVVNYLG